MISSLKSSQRGITLIGIIFVGGVIAVAVLLAAQVVPTYVEFQTITKAANKAKTGQTVPEVRMLFDRSAAVDGIKSISGQDLEVTKENDKVVVSFAYQREIHLVGPAFLTLKYSGKSN